MGTREVRVVTIDVDAGMDFEVLGGSDASVGDALRQRVGGWIEAVASDDNTVTLWINEEGKLLGLPVNVVATKLWWGLCPAATNRDVLCGPVVVSGGPDANGDTKSVPAALERQLLAVCANGAAAAAVKDRLNRG